MEKKRIALTGAVITNDPDSKAILIEEDRIVCVLKNEEIPENYEKTDLTGKYITPGLFDMHGHFYGRAAEQMKSQYDAYCPLYLAGGITTVKTPGEYDPERSWEIKGKIERREMTGPSMMTGSSYFDREPSIVSWMEPCNKIEEIKEKYDRWKEKTDFIKVYSNTPWQWIKALAELAHKDGMKVYGHLGISSAAEAIRAGISGLEHGIYTMSEFYDQPSARVQHMDLEKFDPDSQKATDLIELIIKNDVAITPTTITFILAGTAYTKRLDELNLWRFLTPEALKVQKQRRRDWDADEDIIKNEALLCEKQFRFINRIYKAGGRIFCGTDPSYPMIVPGYAISWEAELLSKCGMTNADILKALTSEAAKELGVFHVSGSSEAGKKADLAVFNKNPLDDIKNIADVHCVYKFGICHKPEDLRNSAAGKMA